MKIRPTLLIALLFFQSTLLGAYAQQVTSDWAEAQETFRALWRQDKKEESLTYLEKVGDRIAEEKGDTDPDYTECLSTLMSYYLAAGNTEKYTETISKIQMVSQKRTMAMLEEARKANEAEIEAAMQTRAEQLRNTYGDFAQDWDDLSKKITTKKTLQEKIQLYESSRRNLTKPSLAHVDLIYSIGKAYEETNQSREARRHYTRNAEFLLRNKKNMPLSKTESDAYNQSVSNLFRAAGREQKTLEYFAVSSSPANSWQELHNQFTKIQDNPYYTSEDQGLAIIKQFEEVESQLFVQTAPGDNWISLCVRTVANMYDQRGQQDRGRGVRETYAEVLEKHAEALRNGDRLTYTNTLRQLKEVYVRLEKKEEAERVQNRIEGAYAQEKQEEVKEDSVRTLTSKLFEAYNRADYHEVIEIYEKFKKYDPAQANSMTYTTYVSSAYIQLGQKEKGEAMAANSMTDMMNNLAEENPSFGVLMNAGQPTNEKLDDPEAMALKSQLDELQKMSEQMTENWQNTNEMTQEERLRFLNQGGNNLSNLSSFETTEKTMLSQIMSSPEYRNAQTLEEKEKIKTAKYREMALPMLSAFGGATSLKPDASFEEISSALRKGWSQTLSDANDATNVMNQDLARVTAQNTQGQAAIRRNLGVEAGQLNLVDFGGFMDSEETQNLVKKSVLMELRTQRVYQQETDAEEKEDILDSLARGWVIEAAQKEEMGNITLSKGASANEALDAYVAEQKKWREKEKERYSSENDEINAMIYQANNMFFDAPALIKHMDQLIEAVTPREVLSAPKLETIKKLAKNSYKDISSESAAKEIASQMILDELADEEERTTIEAEMVKRIADRSEFQKALLPASFNFSFAEEHVTSEHFGNLVEDDAQVRMMKRFLPMMKMYRETYQKALDNKVVIPYEETAVLPTDLGRMEEQAKYRKLILEILTTSHLKEYRNLFEKDEELNTLDFDYLLATKTTDFRTKQLLLEGIKTSEDEALKDRYEQLRVLKDSIGLMNLWTVEERAENGWTNDMIIEESGKIRAEELELYTSLANDVNFGKLAGKFTLSWREIRANLKPGEVFVDIERFERVDDDSVSYLYVCIFPDRAPKLNVVTSSRTRNPETLYRGYQSGIERAKGFEKSFEYYWKPIAAMIGNPSKIYLSPDGIYHAISLNGIYNPTTSKYLHETYDIIQLSDVSDIKNYWTATTSGSNIENIHLFGNPDYNRIAKEEPVNVDPFAEASSTRSIIFTKKRSRPLQPLKYSQPEVDSIAQIALSRKLAVSKFSLTDANELNFTSLKSPHILHLSTHGKFYGGKFKGFLNENKQYLKENPMLRSHLYFAGANKALKGRIVQKSDGVITGEDVAHMDFSATNLVVMSACETGLGDRLDGEGVYGLQRSFLIAGAKSIIMSLWEVDDRATGLFMTTFYHNWLIKQQSKREAFRNAQTSFLTSEKYHRPFYWAAFVLIGE